MSEPAKILPVRQDLSLYEDGLPWVFEFRLLALGNLTGAVITTTFKPKDGSATPAALTITSTPAGLIDSRFKLGYSVPLEGRYDLQIVLAGVSRTYVIGDITLQEDYT